MLKMRKDFFKDSRIKSIKQYPNGDRYVMIFMMLVRMAENDYPRYALVGRDSAPLTVDDIVYFCGVKKSLVEEALLLLDANGLTEVSNGTIYVNFAGLFDDCANCFWNEKRRSKIPSPIWKLFIKEGRD